MRALQSRAHMRRLIRLLIAVSSFSACDDANAPVTSDAEIAAPADTSETADGLDVPGPDTAVDGVEVAAPTRALGLNDVTFLLPPALHALPLLMCSSSEFVTSCLTTGRKMRWYRPYLRRSQTSPLQLKHSPR